MCVCVCVCVSVCVFERGRLEGGVVLRDRVKVSEKKREDLFHGHGPIERKVRERQRETLRERERVRE